MNKYIIFEEAYSSEPQIVSNDGNVLIFVATLQEFDKPNRNRRVYPISIGREMIANEFIQERLKTRTLYVEDQHPLDKNESRQMRLEPGNSVAIITEMWFEGNILKGKLETLASQKGRDYRDMIIYNKIKPAFSLRAKGAVRKDHMSGLLYVESPVMMVGYDTVVTPSHAISWMDTIVGIEDRALNNDRLFSTIQTVKEDHVLMESLETIYNDGLLTPMNNVVKDVRKYSSQIIRGINEMYVPQEGDVLKEASSKCFLVESLDGSKTKMMGEEYLVKDIRSKILKEAFGDRQTVSKDSVRGNIPKAVLYFLVSNKHSDIYVPKDTDRKKIYDEILKIMSSDNNMKREIDSLKKLKDNPKNNKDVDIVRKKIGDILQYIIDTHKKKILF